MGAVAPLKVLSSPHPEVNTPSRRPRNVLHRKAPGDPKLPEPQLSTAHGDECDGWVMSVISASWLR